MNSVIQCSSAQDFFVGAIIRWVDDYSVENCMLRSCRQRLTQAAVSWQIA